jgi:nucleotide-binding universal stress UspA family protein
MIPFKKILVASSFGERAMNTLELALRLAGNTGGTLTVAHVVPPLPEEVPPDAGGLDQVREIMMQAAEEMLQRLVAKLPESDVLVETRVLSGSPAMELVREVLKSGHDLVMTGSGGKKRAAPWFLGTVEMRLLRMCPCPVWVVKADGRKELKRILVPVDPTGSDGKDQELNHTTIQLGAALAELSGANLHVLHAWPGLREHLLKSRLRSSALDAYMSALSSQAQKALYDLLKPYGEAVSPSNRHFLKGGPETVVPDFVRDNRIDLVVMGTVARTGIPGFLMGNTAEKILGRIESSILAVKPSGFVTPVELEG